MTATTQQTGLTIRRDENGVLTSAVLRDARGEIVGEIVGFVSGLYEVTRPGKSYARTFANADAALANMQARPAARRRR